MDLTVADCILYIMNSYDGENISERTIKILIELAFEFQKSIEPRFPPHAELFYFFRNRIAEQWSFILGAATAFGYSSFSLFPFPCSVFPVHLFSFRFSRLFLLIEI